MIIDYSQNQDNLIVCAQGSVQVYSIESKQIKCKVETIKEQIQFIKGFKEYFMICYENNPRII